MLIPALFVADSVNKAAGPERPFDTIIFAGPSDASPVHRGWAREHGITLCNDLDTRSVSDIRLVQARLTSATLMKLLLPGYSAVRYDKILYLDADLTIHDDVSPIFTLDTGDVALAAVPSGRIWADRNDQERRKAEERFGALGMTAPYRYINTGVLLIDVEKWNREDLERRTLSFLRQNSDICILPDEDALNGVLDGRVAELSPIWNMRPPRPGFEITHTIARPVIIHHSGGDKPWRRYGYGKRLFADRSAYRLYESFLADTPWSDWLDQQWSGRDLYKSFVWEARRISRWLRGKLEPSRRQRRAYLEAVRNYVAETDFADVAQGIAIRKDGRIRLKQKRSTMA
jgi:lipopolysaccharide biosynthesis glycosyltransferase